MPPIPWNRLELLGKREIIFPAPWAGLRDPSGSQGGVHQRPK